MKNHSNYEKKWSQEWEDKGVYKTPDFSKIKNKFYCLDMFPYPSGAGLHVGHVEGYTGSDILSRFKRMTGYDVIHPMGWDSFGLPAENYAIKTGVHPQKTISDASKTFAEQMKLVGLSYDWDLEITTSDPEYYRWTQWMFLLLYKNGLAYKKKAKVNWCNSCATVLANEQVENGLCERCESEVVQKDLKQWFFKITDFIEDQGDVKGLLSGLNDIDWPESTKLAQVNWIGKSLGAQVYFKVGDYQVDVFTTRPETLFGCTYLAINPEHEIIEKFSDQISNLSEVLDYVTESKKKTEMERTVLNKEKSGLEIKGLKAINPVNNEEITVFVADYVLAGYGSGAIMAVPAHDERDYDFAKKYNLNLIEVVSGGNINESAYTGEGAMINSDFLNKLNSNEAKEKIIDYLEKKGIGQRSINYRLRDWLVSRQRYWGAPIPIIYCDKCGELPLEEKDLPLILPIDINFKTNGESALAAHNDFIETTCPQCDSKAKREVDTMDNFVCSSWYFFRYLDIKNNNEFSASEKIKKLMPVDVYIGGAEHSVKHLLYARFFTKVLQKYSYIDINEPFKKLRHQGMILAEDNSKMSKSKGNVINPNDIVSEHGADSLRIYEMFMGSFEDVKPWNTKNISGVKRFLDKIISLSAHLEDDSNNGEDYSSLNLLLNKSIKKVGEDIEGFKFNTAISQLMILVNEFGKYKKIPKNYFEKLLLILAPFAPFLSEELWSDIGNDFSIHLKRWPDYDKELLKTESIKLVVQINGKVRAEMMIKSGENEEKVKEDALKNEDVLKYITSKDIKKV